MDSEKEGQNFKADSVGDFEMKIIRAGHSYDLAVLDGDCRVKLNFVERQGDNYPGNTESQCGTTLQEVMRACLDRTEYLNRQKRSFWNFIVHWCLVTAISALEFRAAQQHGRWIPRHPVSGALCVKCNHTGCGGGCHA